MKDFDLIDGLFPAKKAEQAKPTATNESAGAKQRTFKISNEFWDDFVDLAAAKKMTQVELINALIEESVRRDAELIATYRQFFGSDEKR